MKPLLFALCVVFAFRGLSAQTTGWQPSPGHMEVPIWPGAVPDQQPVAGPEESHWWPTGPGGPGGFTVYHVSRPTMTVYSPEGKNTGAALVVFPGGGYEDLAIDLEGTEVCDWLASKGITCVLLKYRVPGEGGYPKSAPYPKSGPYPESPMALEDAQRTVGLVRFHAAERHIDPHKIGVLGFSAGGHLSAAMSTYFAKRLYPAVDAADRESCRPDFAGALYPGHLSLPAAEQEVSDHGMASVGGDVAGDDRNDSAMIRILGANLQSDPPPHSSFLLSSFCLLVFLPAPGELYPFVFFCLQNLSNK